MQRVSNQSGGAVLVWPEGETASCKRTPSVSPLGLKGVPATTNDWWRVGGEPHPLVPALRRHDR